MSSIWVEDEILNFSIFFIKNKTKCHKFLNTQTNYSAISHGQLQISKKVKVKGFKVMLLFCLLVKKWAEQAENYSIKDHKLNKILLMQTYVNSKLQSRHFSYSHEAFLTVR